MLYNVALRIYSPFIRKSPVQQYAPSRLRTATRLDLAWKQGNQRCYFRSLIICATIFYCKMRAQIMRSEQTVNSNWVKWAAWVIVYFETFVVLLSNASPVEFTQTFRVNLVVFSIILLLPLFLPFVIGFWLVIENFARYMIT